MYECKNCGGELRFDIGSQKLICSFCDSRFEPDEYEKEYFAEADEYELNILHCPSCGGEIATTNLSAIEYCPYCGRAVIPETVKATQNKPDLIAPFTVTKEEAKAAYKKYVRKNRLAPSVLKNEEFLEGFQGMYLPFWSYDVSFSNKPNFEFKVKSTKGDYTYTDTYALTGDMDAGYEGITYDASSYFDDVIGQSIVPFDQSKARPFNPSYMFGFYGEVQDVKPTVYEQEALATANRSLFENFEKAFPGESIDFPVKSRDRQNAFGAEIKDTKNVMFPIWFLTWRNRNNVAYAVVNGQNGKTYADVPISPMKIALLALLLAIPVFGILYFGLPTLSIYTMLLIASVIGVISVYMSGKMADQIYDQTERINKKKPFVRESKVNANGVSSPIDLTDSEVKTGKILQKIGELFFYFVFILLLFGSSAITVIAYINGMQRRTQRSIGYVVVLIATVIIFYRAMKRKEERVASLIRSAGALIGIAVAGAVHLWNPADDFYYYIAAMIVGAGIIWSLACLVRQYNSLATHPDPYFFKGRKAK